MSDGVLKRATRLLIAAIFVLAMALVLLASNGRGALAQTNPFAGDVRLQKQRTITASGRTLNDLMADIGRETAIRFFVAASHREDKVIVYAHNRTLADTLNAIANLYGLEWKRSGKAPDFGYTLQQSVASAEAESREINAPLRTVIDQIRAEAREASIIETLTREERDKQANTLAAEIDPRSPQSSPPDALRGVILRRSWANVPTLEAAYSLIRLLSPKELEDVMANGAVYHWPASTNRRLLPEAIFKQVRDMLRRSGSFSVDDDVNFATVRLSPSTEVGLRLECNVSGGIELGASTSARHVSIALPLAVSASTPAIEPMRRVFDWRSNLNLSKSIEIQGPIGSLPGTLPWQFVPLPPLVPVIDALQKRLPFDVVADAFWTTDISLNAQPLAPLGSILDAIAQQCTHDCWLDGGFVSLRSKFFAADRVAEPPATSIYKWAQRANKDLCTIDDYAEIAALPGRQLASAIRVLERAKLREHTSVIYQAQSALEFWNSLSRTQRTAAREQGLKYADLTVSQRPLFQAFANERDRLRSQVRSETERSLDELTSMTFRAIITDSPIFRAARNEKGQGAMLMSGISIEEVYEQIRTIVPSIKLSDITKMITTTAQFTYGNSRRYTTRTFVRLPVRADPNQ